ncbi:potassium transporter Kup [Burkholderia ubonensis]|uniref:Probable potassium transport system protein Kup n=1 Tax=Burkholderia ubonensis TaxID=101571 RepID=A0A107G857_9BURK|nr:potassium transporter Kup [Burkholderia ubonensis]AOK62431.1 potassium transporter Kup [Burkholderia ubonensis]KWD72102.1 potassium transporter Kup [Burkholderia ubonensis]KWD76361.1 potassium transporter Kup [Burkholderia ubonensis]KWD99415.1 potassium transporter Kup [Burkholderia ubonensis]KWE07098.1 potassium transporter Kup [Burkholderia ubonensis]
MEHSASAASNADRLGMPGRHKPALPALALAALGVVYGDIGTSPLYTLSTVFDPVNGLALNAFNLVGIVSLIFWSLMVVVSLKYVVLILRANNHGEGGIMALLALAASSVASRPRLRRALLVVGVMGASLFFGDSVITPAISVLSAVEGLEVVAPVLKTYVIPVTLAALIALFIMQKHGTSGIGAVFGPVMVSWFVVIGIAGAVNIAQMPAILFALDPLRGLAFCLHHRWLAFVALGAVVLSLTGAEALYADMGHFGKRPIRVTWFGVVFPSLALNYLGQGALLLAHPGALQNPFYRLFPQWAIPPMIALATIATVVASQAVISGTYSMTKQAMQLGFLPRMNIVYTSGQEMGQIYVPGINWTLLAAVVAAVLGFGSSTALGSAYGIAVTGTMLITTFLTFFVVRYAWHYNWLLCVLATAFFFAIDAMFFSANLLKIVEGGWFPLAIGTVVFTIMATWGRGWEMLLAEARVRAGTTPLKPYLNALLARSPARVAGTAIFLTPTPEAVPHALVNNLMHNRVLHERVMFVTVITAQVPWVPDSERVRVQLLCPGCHQVTITYGFKDEVDLPKALGESNAAGLAFVPAETSWFLSRASVVPTPGHGMALWRERLFAVMLHNVGNIAAFFKLPANRVIEVGARVEI